MEKICVFILLVLVALTNNLVMAEFSETQNLSIKDQLNILNKPAIKTFQTKYGEILDCIEIDKQLALDHPLLKNHSIQMKPSNNTQRLGILKGSSKLNGSKQWLKNIRCPKGSVVIKRITKEDLVMPKLISPLSGINSNGHQYATLVMPTENVGVHGSINVWGPQVTKNQTSTAYIFVASQEGVHANALFAGWIVNSDTYPNRTTLYVYWMNGESTGCFNTLCPGFVQISQKVHVGLILSPLSTYGGDQFEIILSILQDDTTGNWWVKYGEENVGYYPKELVTSLSNGASRGGWGGEIYNPVIDEYPAMGSGHFPEEGFKKACFIRQMKLLSHSHSGIYPDKNKLVQQLSMPQCYKLLYAGDFGGDSGHTMLFGGPPDCKLWPH